MEVKRSAGVQVTRDTVLFGGRGRDSLLNSLGLLGRCSFDLLRSSLDLLHFHFLLFDHFHFKFFLTTLSSPFVSCRFHSKHVPALCLLTVQLGLFGGCGLLRGLGLTGLGLLLHRRVGGGGREVKGDHREKKKGSQTGGPGSGGRWLLAPSVCPPP